MDSLIKLKCFSAMMKILNTVDIYSSIKSLLYLSKILGLAPYTYSKRKSEYRIRISTARTIRSLVMSGLLVTFFFVMFSWDIENFYTLDFIIGIILLSDSHFLLFSFIVSYGVCAIVNRCTVMNFLKLVTTVEAWLIKSSISYRKLFQSLCLVVTVLVIFNSTCYCMNFRIPSHVNSNSIRMVYFVLIFIGGFAMFHFIFVVPLLKGQFEILD